MGIITILATIVICYLLAAILNKSNEQRRLLESLYDKIKDLNKEVTGLSGELKRQKTEIAVQPGFNKPTAAILTPVKPQPVKETPVIPVPKPVIPAQPVAVQEKTAAQKSTSETPEYKFSAPPHNEKDLEKYIGETLISKIGIAILILGISFFIKYAIDKNWINETGRVITGFICGGILTGFAHRFRNTYRSFSSVLVGGGLTVFYFSTAFAFHQYHLIGQTTAFIIMVAITGFAVFLSVFYNRLELAILAVIGGFITPFLASTGNDNYVALFTYLCILNAGIIVLSWFKKWPAINSIALFFTTIIFGGWLFQATGSYSKALFPYNDSLLFATAFFLLFTVMHIINSLRLKSKFTAFDSIMVLGTNGLYYFAGMVILSYAVGGEGLFTFLLGIFHLALCSYYYKNKSIDRNFISLLIGLSVTFISLAVPVQFSGNYTVLFWAAESVVLLWLFRRTGIWLLFYASLIITVLAAGSLIINWASVYFISQHTIPVVLNKGFITAFVTGLAFTAYYYLISKISDLEQSKKTNTDTLRSALQVAFISVFYLTGLLEIYYQFNTRLGSIPVHFLYMELYTYGAAVLLLYVFRKHSNYTLLKLFLTLLCTGIYFTNISSSVQLAVEIAGTSRSAWFLVHWISAALLLWMLYDLFRFFFRQQNAKWAEYKSSLGWLLSICLLIVLSTELYQANLWANLHDDWLWWQNLYYKAGLSILWGVFSFVLIWVGMKYKHRVLRIISLSLFTITIAKLFIYDIRNIPPGGKIAAFILLGILLLVVSFMYQRLKKIIIDNTVE